MRIFDRLLAPKAKVDLRLQNGSFESVSISEDMRVGVRDSIKVVADDCAFWYWRSGTDWDYNTHFGPLRLPFSTVWLEWRVPSRLFWSDKKWTRSEFSSCASFIREGKPYKEAPFGTYSSLRSTWFLELNNTVISPLAVHYLHVTEDGKVLGNQCMTFTSDQKLINSLSKFFEPAHLALGLMNCKNVKVEEVTPDPKLAKARMRKHGAPSHKYHVISLPGNPQIRSNKDAAEAGGGAMPLHLVRGHFKTYTSEAPLMGQHTGTYWWGWQTRGKKSAGRVDKHYEVERPG